MWYFSTVLSVGDQSYPFVLHYLTLSKKHFNWCFSVFKKGWLFLSIHWNLKTWQIIYVSLETRVLRVELMHFTSYCLNLNIRFGARWKDSANNEYWHGTMHSRPSTKDYSSVARGLWGWSCRTFFSWLCEEGVYTSKYLPYRVVVRIHWVHDVLCQLVDLIR